MRRRLAALFILWIILIQAAAGAEQASCYGAIEYYSGYFHLAETAWVVENPKKEGDPASVRSQADGYRTLAEKCGADLYVYLVETSRCVDFDNLQEDVPIWPLLQESYPGCTLDHLKIDSVETYCNWFYQTDHHWNYKGSYEGYTEIIRMLLGEDEPLLEPVETVSFPFVFNGSYYKRMNRNDGHEGFTVYRFEYPEMTIMINESRRKSYGKADLYFGGEIVSPMSLTNHYAEFYGGDTAMVQFCTHREDRENILIISNSYSNAVDMLIASHFNITLVVDPREIKSIYGEGTTLGTLIRGYQFDKILLLGDSSFFMW